MLGDTVEISVMPDADEVWVVAAVIMAGLILSPNRSEKGWRDIRRMAVREALLLRGECERACVDRKEEADRGKGSGVGSGSGGGATAVVQPAEGSPADQGWAAGWTEI